MNLTDSPDIRILKQERCFLVDIMDLIFSILKKAKKSGLAVLIQPAHVSDGIG